MSILINIASVTVQDLQVTITIITSGTIKLIVYMQMHHVIFINNEIGCNPVFV